MDFSQHLNEQLLIYRALLPLVKDASMNELTIARVEFQTVVENNNYRVLATRANSYHPSNAPDAIMQNARLMASLHTLCDADIPELEEQNFRVTIPEQQISTREHQRFIIEVRREWRPLEVEHV